jgi:hypothetical protein
MLGCPRQWQPSGSTAHPVGVDQLALVEQAGRLLEPGSVSQPVEAVAMADKSPSQPDPGGQRGSGSGAEPAPAQGGRSSRPARQFRPSRGRRVGDAIMSVFVRAGLVPSTYLLTTRGRKTGRPLTHPATVVEQDGRRWLVAPYGEVSWVHNARAAGRVTWAAAATGVTMPSARSLLGRLGRCSSAMSALPRPPGRTFVRTRTLRWRTSWPRPTATRCSSFSPSREPGHHRGIGHPGELMREAVLERLASDGG